VALGNLAVGFVWFDLPSSAANTTN